jgi:hypothetical protein
VVVDLGGRPTWYRLCAILIPLCIIIPKIVTSLRGESLAPELDGHDIGLLGGTVSPNHPAYVPPKRLMHSRLPA